MRYNLFATENGASLDDKCFSIGCLLIPVNDINPFCIEIENLCKKHNLDIHKDLTWEKASKSSEFISFTCDLFGRILTDSANLVFIVVEKRKYRLWLRDKNKAFHKTYTMMLEHCSKILYSDLNKTDPFSEGPTINRRVVTPEMKELSKSIQDSEPQMDNHKILSDICSIFTHAVNLSHNLFIEPKDIPEGESSAIVKISDMIGWDALHYDTFPNPKFNIWHFPKENRAVPESREIVIE
jgi:hypothetical protein